MQRHADVEGSGAFAHRQRGVAKTEGMIVAMFAETLPTYQSRAKRRTAATRVGHHRFEGVGFDDFGVNDIDRLAAVAAADSQR